MKKIQHGIEIYVDITTFCITLNGDWIVDDNSVDAYISKTFILIFFYV